jgi:hypothetical protein
MSPKGHKLLKQLHDARYDVWVDYDGIYTGDSWRRKIDEALDHCDGLILLLTPEACNSEHVKSEIKSAQKLAIPIFPVLIAPVDDIPTTLKTLGLDDSTHVEDFTTEEDWNPHFTKLLESLDYYELKPYDYVARQITIFEHLISNSSWNMREDNGKTLWTCRENTDYQIIYTASEKCVENYTDKWVQVYLGKGETWSYKVHLQHNGNIIEGKSIVFVACDGGRITVAQPDAEQTSEGRVFFWHANSLNYKLTCLIGTFDTFKTVAEIAHRSHIEIR